MTAALRLSPTFLLVALLAPAPCAAQEDLAAGLKAVLDRPEYRSSRWGLLVVDLATGKPVFEHNADQLFAPASVTKLYSCAASLTALGPDYRFETPVYRRGPLREGKLEGDLILVAQGDFTLGGRTTSSGKMAFRDEDHIYATATGTGTALTDTNPLAGLEDLARQVKAAGITSVSGDVLIDDRLFEHARGTGSGPDLLTPIMVNDNLIDVIVTPTKAGSQAVSDWKPRTEFVQVDVQVETVPKGGKLSVRAELVAPHRYSVRGTIPEGARPVVRTCNVDDPAGFARALFLAELRRQGVEVKASALRPPTAELPEQGSYTGLTRVAQFRSPPLSEALKVTLKVSHNLYASTLPLLLAVKAGKRTLPEGMRREGRILSELGVPVKGISLESGAGGGNGDRVSPRATVQLLQSMSKRADFNVFKEALPVLGVDGTLASVGGKDSPARGKVWAKTGTYGDRDLLNGRVYLRSKALAGVMTTAKGKSLAFAFFVNDVPHPPGVTPQREGQALGKICEIVYQAAP
jgi:D-alanyl-D-alanine carboxypeptidase/D-alanyl-D-alanine-endopeptidase (penicillin-binding protein 4)